MNLIPNEPGKNLNAWCTWGTQNFALTPEQKEDAKPKFIGDQGGSAGRDSLTEKNVFGPNGWAYGCEAIRSDLYFLIDDGWDFPARCADALPKSGSCILNSDRFPSFTGTPAERLRKFNDKLKSIGWRGLGIWVASQMPGETLFKPFPMGKLRQHWKERLEWCRDAGIEYVKMDWGSHSTDPEFRRMISELNWEIAPDTMIEHIISHGPMNDLEPTDSGVTGSGRFANETDYLKRLDRILEFSDFVRTYDVADPFDQAATLDRTAYYLTHAHTGCVINVEDPVYIGAALGCASGIMRSPFWITDTIAKRSKRFREVERMVYWQRIAPAFAIGQDEIVRTSETILTDRWIFRPGTTWAKPFIDKLLYQSAPAVIARNAALPCISGDELPFAVCARNPNGALSLATLNRISPEKGLYNPQADIVWEEDCAGQKLGIFGTFHSLKIRCSVAPVRVFAQDLAEKEAMDVTKRLTVSEGYLTIPGELIHEINTPKDNDCSDPGIVFFVQKGKYHHA